MVRTKVRWILFELVEDPTIVNGQVTFTRTAAPFDEEFISSCIWKAIAVDYGQFGNGMLRNVTVKWFNQITRTGILRVLRDYADILLASLFFMKKLHNHPCSFRILRVSGTIISIQNHAILRDRDIYLQERDKAQKKGQTYSITDKMEESSKKIKAIKDAI
ncbi:hypothetical protein BX666DRAFT_2003767 [Dichotomocladium elegans]|nr:hypothetical protein BX666DRAFT_2003767 [Dichotomocladium elegans]